MRASWDEVWLGVAGEVSRRSRCDLARVGAVIVDVNNRVVAVGYNGPPRHFPVEDKSTCELFCPRAQKRAQGLTYGLQCPSIHAEANALMFSDRRDYEGGTIYVTRACCQDCTKLIANSGVARVVMFVLPEDAHRNPEDSIAFLRSCDIIVSTVQG